VSFSRFADSAGMPMDSRDLIGELERDGWFWHSTTGSHRHFKHPTKPGKVTVPHPKKDMHPKTVKSIRTAAGLQST
jgi:predicted RNA binding protein YcfA (HicA-like mRNA interferase family)